jgi:hypothetical protein
MVERDHTVLTHHRHTGANGRRIKALDRRCRLTEAATGWPPNARVQPNLRPDATEVEHHRQPCIASPMVRSRPTDSVGVVLAEDHTDERLA